MDRCRTIYSSLKAFKDKYIFLYTLYPLDVEAYSDYEAVVQTVSFYV